MSHLPFSPLTDLTLVQALAAEAACAGAGVADSVSKSIALEDALRVRLGHPADGFVTGMNHLDVGVAS